MPDRQDRLSRSVEDYLKAILALAERGKAASTSALARSLAVQPASVTGMVKKLAENGLLEHIPYRGVQLTESGQREALRILRRHRILETYLTERLDYAWDEVHDEAEHLEHAVSDRLIEAMAAALGDPERDPHGAPIPSADGVMASTPIETLADAPCGVPLSIQAVRDDNADQLIEMESQGLTPGTMVEVLTPGVNRDELRVRVGGAAGSVEHVTDAVARRIFVGSSK